MQVNETQELCLKGAAVIERLSNGDDCVAVEVASWYSQERTPLVQF